MVQEAEQFASADADRKAKVEAKNDADSAVYTTEKTLMEHKDKVPQEDQDAIKADMASLKDASANGDISAAELTEKIEALKKSSMKIGEAMYKNSEGGDSSAGGDSAQSADYEDVKKEDKKEDKKEEGEKK